jgi:hypothetical protein
MLPQACCQPASQLWSVEVPIFIDFHVYTSKPMDLGHAADHSSAMVGGMELPGRQWPGNSRIVVARSQDQEFGALNLLF